MLKLKNVSKFYYSKGVIASGFSKVNLELSMGEFVVITGESGSGKSTLLNVLSGLDTYEEGEMYINGEETSHYNEADFEEYRRKYVGNIFQNFNLVNSYTVYQNVELALVLNGENKKKAKERVLEIISKVGLSDFANTKCSKLSGGQKQRVAIARALAKETPIIVADEPTGNLDSKSAEEVVRLLSEISKDKLVIIVTHNLEQVEQYATRLIKMHDGKILEDKTIKPAEFEEKDASRTFADITVSDRFRLGARNSFNIPSKFILIFAVFLFISFAVAGTYSSFEKMAYDESLFGYSEFFVDTSDKRVVINKPDRTAISEEEFSKIKAMDNVERIVEDDTLVDYTMSISDIDYWYYFYGNFVDIKDFKGKLTKGRMPEKPNEIILEGSAEDYYLNNDEADSILDKDFYTENYDANGERKVSDPLKIVGIIIKDKEDYSGNDRFYVGDEILDKIRLETAMQNNNVRTLFEGQYYRSYPDDPSFRVTPNKNVPKGEAYVSSMLNDYTQNGRAVGKEMVISADSIYNRDSMTVKISGTYNKTNLKSLTGVDFKEEADGAIYVNEEDYNNLIDKGIFQSSVYVKNAKELDETLKSLKDMGFETLPMRDSLSKSGGEMLQMINLMKTFMLAILIAALFFISYFIIKIVLKSRNAYYTTLRTLGASRRISKQLLDIELFITATIAYGVFMLAMGLVYSGVITNSMIVDLAGYLTPVNYVLIYVVIVAMSYLISHRFARKLFKDSVMNTYREEV